MGEKVAFIGLGAMGGPMALNIIKKETNLSVFDIEKEKMEPHIKLGAVPGKKYQRYSWKCRYCRNDVAIYRKC